MKLQGRSFILAFVLSASGLGAAAALYVLHRDDPTPVAALPNEDLSETVSLAPMEATLRQEAAARDSGPTVRAKSVRDSLQEYYGARWADVQAAFEAEMGKTLDEPADAHPLQPWESVADQIRERLVPSSSAIEQHAEALLEWDESQYSDWGSIRKSFPGVPENMGATELAEFREVADAANARILDLGVQRTSILAALGERKWSEGAFVKSPYSLPSALHPSSPNRVAKAQLAVSSPSGWVVCMPLYSDELPPEYDELAVAITKAKGDRSRVLAAYLRSKQ